MATKSSIRYLWGRKSCLDRGNFAKEIQLYGRVEHQMDVIGNLPKMSGAKQSSDDTLLNPWGSLFSWRSSCSSASGILLKALWGVKTLISLMKVVVIEADSEKGDN